MFDNFLVGGKKTDEKKDGEWFHHFLYKNLEELLIKANKLLENQVYFTIYIKYFLDYIKGSLRYHKTDHEKVSQQKHRN